VLDEVDVQLGRLVPESLSRPSDERLAALVRAAVAAVPGPLALGTVDGPTRPRVRLKVEVELGYAAAGGTLRAVVHARLEPKSGPSGGAMRVDREAVVEKESLPRAPDAALIEAHLQRAFELTVGGAMRAEQLWLAPPTDARAALDEKEGDRHDEAIRIAGERRDRTTVPRLIALLKTEDGEQRDAIIGALAEIGDERAVRPLADLAKFGDVDELPKILDALSRIGGPEVISYLEFVAGGHPSPELRDQAKRALEHVRARPPSP
jgi:hypothetical protein